MLCCTTYNIAPSVITLKTTNNNMAGGNALISLSLIPASSPLARSCSVTP